MKKCCPGLPLVFVIVFIVGAFLYYQYSFTSTSKINFNEDSFYQKQDDSISLFVPQSSRYKLCFYSSFTPNFIEFLTKNTQESPTLAIDFYQQGQEMQKHIKNLIELKISSTLMLKLIHEFDVKILPQCFIVKQDSKDSKLYTYLIENGIYKLVNFRENEK